MYFYLLYVPSISKTLWFAMQLFTPPSGSSVAGNPPRLGGRGATAWRQIKKGWCAVPIRAYIEALDYTLQSK